MNRFAVLCSALSLVGPMAAAGTKPVAGHSKELVTRGRYLVENLGMCEDCHSPRDEKGQFIRGRHLEGARLDFQPIHRVPNWAPASPPIAGLPGWTSAEAIRFFMMGLDRVGKQASPPMPQYRMSREDAEAVVAYLKSLHAAGK